MMNDIRGDDKGEISGILVVDKEKGMTSHDVVDIVRKRTGIKKVGHAGTLDPNATGVLVILMGKATKFSDKLSGEDKLYKATMRLGERTNSGDCDGLIVSRRDISVDTDKIKEVMSLFLGEIEQVPPMFSAKKIAGKRLYKIARKGEVVERPPVKVTIKKLEVTNISLPEVEFEVLCSKGTYIRQLADDIGEALLCGAHITELRRLSSGSFDLSNSVSVSELKKMDREKIDENIIRIQGRS